MEVLIQEAEGQEVNGESGGGFFFSAVSEINGSAGTCHSEGQRGTISDDDGGTDPCHGAEPGCQSQRSAPLG